MRLAGTVSENEARTAHSLTLQALRTRNEKIALQWAPVLILLVPVTVLVLLGFRGQDLFQIAFAASLAWCLYRIITIPIQRRIQRRLWSSMTGKFHEIEVTAAGIASSDPTSDLRLAWERTDELVSLHGALFLVKGWTVSIIPAEAFSDDASRSEAARIIENFIARAPTNPPNPERP